MQIHKGSQHRADQLIEFVGMPGEDLRQTHHDGEHHEQNAEHHLFDLPALQQLAQLGLPTFLPTAARCCTFRLSSSTQLPAILGCITRRIVLPARPDDGGTIMPTTTPASVSAHTTTL
ncbi:hypothetical protein LBW62_16545 [Ralstonia solanacearum]|uniref:hypothetical protein n=1 Tax=Ralstonia solanacearum TaxID=305 RepID=UPI0006990090|nr:hypothetical protein [Ralstonia solanacearum]MDB0542791.1 hypothetical protein [Ralstonia solanacearum]MDB0553072.1 hypothetical protein [Ralstonia solanacearum]MDB0557797.1 hypothetical protein [Ralstonia solanacearum]